jgi:phosphoribosylamine-glycine ligase
VGRGPDLSGARDQAERAADMVRWDGRQRRHDIGAMDAAATSLAGVAR